MVFGDASRRRALNKIMAGHIAKAMALQCLWHFAIGTAVIILDVPLLYETGVHRVCTPHDYRCWESALRRPERIFFGCAFEQKISRERCSCGQAARWLWSPSPL